MRRGAGVIIFAPLWFIGTKERRRDIMYIIRSLISRYFQQKIFKGIIIPLKNTHDHQGVHPIEQVINLS